MGYNVLGSIEALYELQAPAVALRKQLVNLNLNWNKRIMGEKTDSRK